MPECPSLPAPYIRQALESAKDLAIGPSSDGGYYLIGMGEKRVDVFDGVAWGTESVLTQTLERVRRSGADVELLPLWYDVDRPEDLRFLKTHLEWMEHAGLGPSGPTGDFLKHLEF